MPKVDDLRQSNYLKQGDVDPPILVTIDHWEEHNMGKEGQPPDMKYVLFFKEDVKQDIKAAIQNCKPANDFVSFSRDPLASWRVGDADDR